MIKKLVGIILIIASFLLIITFISKGMFFPHLSGPVLLGAIGIILLLLKQVKKT